MNPLFSSSAVATPSTSLPYSLPEKAAAMVFHQLDHTENPPFWVPGNWEASPELSVHCSIDQRPIIVYSQAVISGYLNLSGADGWSEGHDYRVGEAFTRFILLRYYFEKMDDLGANKIVMEKSIRAYLKSSPNIQTFFPGSPIKDHRPTESRIAFDSEVTGWDKHAVSRLSGNLGSQYSKEKPFFEILVNSARNSLDDPYCRPFHVSIHFNEEMLDKRRQTLMACKMKPGLESHFVFYAPSLMSPNQFLVQYPERLGPNSTRLLKALCYLQSTTLCAQKVGNCWIKQPMRGLLATLFVELITHRNDLEIEQAWDEAKRLYKDIQKCAAIPTIEGLIKDVKMTDEMKAAYEIAIEKQKTL
ncbi:hypothetical protein [Estrella lausannensis]|uniref:Uncharacterized protein n=1 Tax=Estrella lausannensis TaxID=483423 RepID=A0A0H5DN56_9BACT|nr:hypothetical protein [Estrella lausannensis]CRX37681.1 conserved hypothetical protein [Estrella lausannensis]